MHHNGFYFNFDILTSKIWLTSYKNIYLKYMFTQKKKCLPSVFDFFVSYKDRT